MATKTISLELDAYEKLRRMKRGKESFSAVVRRAEFPSEAHTGEAILSELLQLSKCTSGPKKSTFKYWKQVVEEESTQPRITQSKWDRK